MRLVQSEERDSVTPSLTERALAGAAWNWGSSGVAVATQIASTAATARLIDPAGFGAYAAAQAAAGILGYFTLTTIGLGVMRRRELGPQAVGSALAISVLGGAGVSLFLLTTADLWAQAWGVGGAAVLIRILAGSLLFNALGSVPLALARRRLRFGAIAAAEVVTLIAGQGLSVGLAVLMHSPVALATGQLATEATLCIIGVLMVRSELTVRFSAHEFRGLGAYASQLSLLNLLAYLLNTAPAWLISRVFGAAILGLYSRASLIVLWPLTYVSSGMSKVLFPLYGRVQAERARVSALLAEALILTSGTTWPALALLAGAAQLVVDTVLGAQWSAAAPLLQLTVLAACGTLPARVLSAAAEVEGWMRTVALRHLVVLAMLGIAVPVTATGHLGIHGLLVLVGVAQWAVCCLLLLSFHRAGVVGARAVASASAVHGLVAALVYASSSGLDRILVLYSSPLRIGAQLTLATVTFFVLLRARRWYPASRVLRARARVLALSGTEHSALSRLAEIAFR